MKRRLLTLICAAALLATVCLSLAGCAASDDGPIRTVDDLAGRRVAVLSGTVYDQLVEEYIPDCTTVYAYAGYDVDIAVRFCREYGYKIEFVDSEFAGIFTAVSTGKCDFGAGCITITDERKESMLFSDPDYVGGVVTVVRDRGPKSEHADGFIAAVRGISPVGRFLAKCGFSFARLSRGECRTIYNTTVLPSERIPAERKSVIRELLTKLGCRGLTVPM